MVYDLVQLFINGDSVDKGEKEVYTIGGYIFDPDRLILYKEDMSDKDIKIINNEIYSNEDSYEKVYSSLIQINSDEMCMDKVDIDSCGIIPSYNCNLRCRYCAYSSKENSEFCLQFKQVQVFIKDIIRRKTINKLITKQNTPLHIDMTGGGEPTYDWSFLVKIVTYIHDECNRVGIPFTLGMTTNGVLTDEQIDFIIKHFNKLMVSYDGLPEIQNQNRCSLTRKNVNSIVEHTIYRLSKSNIELTVRTTIWQEHFSLLQDMYNHVLSIVAPNGRVIWSVWPTQSEGRALLFSSERKVSLTKDFLKICMNLKKQNAIKSNSPIKNIEFPVFVNSSCEMFCGAPSIVCEWLLPDASIVTCVESPIGKVTIGKVLDDKVEYYNEYSDVLLKTTQKKYTECRNCIAFYFCRGGCPVWHLREESSGNLPQECILQIEYLKYVIEAALKGDYSLGWRLTPIDVPNVEGPVYKLVIDQQN